jgi:hypothetical protein
MVAREPALYNELRGVVGLFTHPRDYSYALANKCPLAQ